MHTYKYFNLFFVGFFALFALNGFESFAGATQSQSRPASGDFDLICIAVTPMEGRYALELPRTGNHAISRHNGIDHFHCSAQRFSPLGTGLAFKHEINLFDALKGIEFLDFSEGLNFVQIVRNEDVDYLDLLSQKLKVRNFDNFPAGSLPFLFVSKRSGTVHLEVRLIRGFYNEGANNEGDRIVKFRRNQPVLNTGEGPSFIRALLSAFPDVESTIVSVSESS